MTQELPHETYTRVTGKDWPGGTSEKILALLSVFNIKAVPGSAEANVALQRKLLETYGPAPAPDSVAQNIGHLAIEVRRLKNSVEEFARKFPEQFFDQAPDWTKYRAAVEKLEAALQEAAK